MEQDKAKKKASSSKAPAQEAGVKDSLTTQPAAEQPAPYNPKARPNAGAGSKRTPERREAILSALELGMSLEGAAKFAGLHFDTLNEWRKSDAEFSQDVEKARHSMEWDMLERIKIAAQDPKNWAAAAWKLERIIPDRYGRKWQPLAMVTETENQGAPGKTYKVSVEPVVDEAKSDE